MDAASVSPKGRPLTITAAADGSALGNPGPAGWAWYVDDGCWAAGGWPHATNNRGELQAVLELFRATAHVDDDLLVLCDSLYVINSVTKWMRGWKAKGWRKGDGKPVLNVDLLQELDAELAGRGYRFEWVKGHANHPLNEAADLRARSAAEAFQRNTAVPGGPGWNRDGDPRVTATRVRPVPDPEPARIPQPGLFDLEDAHAAHRITLELSDAEHARLLELARSARLSPSEFLRRSIGN